MGELFTTLFGAVGGLSGLLTFGALLLVIVIAVFISRFTGGTGSGVTDRIVSLASYAVMAVKKLSDNGQFDDMSEKERHAAKKEQALEIIREGLRAEGIKPNTALMSFAGYAIETTLKYIDDDPDEDTSNTE